MADLPTPSNPREAVQLWRRFAQTTVVEWKGNRRSWADHIKGRGAVDEEQLVQPLVFPRFAAELLGFEVGVSLAAERTGAEGKPDFTPADAVTHPFVFETKSSREGSELAGHHEQVQRYLLDGRPRIRQVALTNLVGLQIFELDETSKVRKTKEVNLRALLAGDDAIASGLRDARELLAFLTEFRFRELTLEEKLTQIRDAPPWNPLVEITSSSWISARLDRVVGVLTQDVGRQVSGGVLTDSGLVTDAERQRVLSELQLLAWRLGVDWDEATGLPLEGFLGAREGSPIEKALRQYEAHLAYYAATRLLLVRIWEDLDLLEPVLYDGGFDHWMSVFDGDLSEVVSRSFRKAQDRYRSLFTQQNSYTWYRPGRDSLAEAIYELANTYLGSVESDVLGEVYERLLERIDRKILGQYYTPRDVIALMWDMLGIDPLAQRADDEGRGLRVLDIASGSGGFLVEAARRLADRYSEARGLGASLGAQEWMDRTASGLNGIELQRFPAYLGELNLLIQHGRLQAQEPDLRIPSLGIVPTDTLSLHNPETLLDADPHEVEVELLLPDDDRRERAKRIKNPATTDEWFDVAIGNPPYVGEKAGASMMADTRARYPYWNQYSGHHMDYLYWFLILGISKLRKGGRFAFITTEYWLRATGARPLRGFLAANCRIDDLVLFRGFKLFPDAPGQDSLIVVGERCTEPGGPLVTPPAHRPHVRVFRGSTPRSSIQRAAVLAAIRNHSGASEVESFRGARTPRDLDNKSWSEVVLSPAQFKRRKALRTAPLEVDFEEGVLSGANRMRASYADQLPPRTLASLGWPERSHGIFVLDPEELSALGTLTEVEQAVVRPFVNTQDLLPYAAVLPENHDSILYLVTPPGARSVSDRFPADMPALERHLRRFKPILDAKVESYNERRPWWSLHRPRPTILAHDRVGGGWANYCLTANWGTGGRLIVGLAPGGCAPAHGMHAVIPPDGVPAGYVNAVINSTAVQALAETLPPGYLRRDDLVELGVPLVGDAVNDVSGVGEQLADLVAGMARDLAPRFPSLPAALAASVTLDDVPAAIWTPRPGPSASWGALADVGWVAGIRRAGAPGTRVRFVEIQETLLGLSVVATAKEGDSRHLTLDVPGHDLDVGQALASLVRGLAARGATFRDVPRTRVPIHREALLELVDSDAAMLQTWLEAYRTARRQVDEIVDSVL